MSIVNGLTAESRPPYVSLTVILVALGAAAGAYDGAVEWPLTLLVLAALVGLHTAAAWGGARRMAAAVVATAAVIAIALLADFFPALLLVPIAAAVLYYTPIAERLGLGLGELTGALGIGVLPVVLAATLSDGFLGPAALFCAAAAFFLTFGMLLMQRIADAEPAQALAEPARARAEPARAPAASPGRSRGAPILYGVMALLAPAALLAGLVLAALPWTALLALLPAVLLVRPLSWALGRPSQPLPAGAAGTNAVANRLTHALLAFALVIAILFAF